MNQSSDHVYAEARDVGETSAWPSHDEADHGGSVYTPVARHDSYGVAFAGLVATSAGMRQVFDLAMRLSTVDVPAVLEGETGAGKSALAEAIHAVSSRANSGPCIVLDCAVLANGYLDATLFGYEMPEGADGPRPGVFEQASGGTLVLDHIDELDADAQAKVSRVLEVGRIRRLGGVYEVPVDVRVLATSRRDLAALVHSGAFREELYYRVALTRVYLPPLRERLEDVPLLLRCFADRVGVGGAPELEALIERAGSYPWPGNVRELKNAFDRWLAFGDEALGLGLAHASAGRGGGDGRMGAPLDDAMHRILELNLSLPRARQQVVAEFERRYIERVLRLNEGSIARAAEASGIARRYFRLLRARIRERNASA